MREAVDAEILWVYKINGLAVDVSAYNQLNLHVQRPTGFANLNIVHTPVDLAAGIFKFVLVPDDLVPGLSQLAYGDFLDAFGKADTTVDILIDVIPR